MNQSHVEVFWLVQIEPMKNEPITTLINLDQWNEPITSRGDFIGPFYWLLFNDLGIKAVLGMLFTKKMKHMNVHIAIKDENRYASVKNDGIEDIEYIQTIENYNSDMPKVSLIKNDGTIETSKEHKVSKQQLLDQIIQNIRYLQRYPDMK